MVERLARRRFLLRKTNLLLELVTFEPFGKRRKEYGGAIDRMATKRAGASESSRNKPEIFPAHLR
jgi:hypothetical protein